MFVSLKWLSQHPEEDEVLFPPLSYIEIVGEPRKEEVNKRTVMFHSCRLNVNQRTGPLEDHMKRRKRLHISMIQNACFEVERDLDEQCCKLPESEKSGRGKNQGEGFKVKELVVALCHDVYGAHLAVQDKDYYDEIRYHAMVEEAAGIYEQAKVIFHHWRDDTSTYFGDDLLPSDASTTSLAKIYRIICGLAKAQYRCAKLRPEEAQGATVAPQAGASFARGAACGGLEGGADEGSVALTGDARAATLEELAAKVLRLLTEGISEEALRRAASTDNALVLELLLDAGALKTSNASATANGNPHATDDFLTCKPSLAAPTHVPSGLHRFSLRRRALC